ncbi:four helix bundle protein [Jeotgalibacillus sp. JSM ZJ347]|uniref:four helix bundle protein n=1 Tax=Jeotgalibacillus sp. JSM ZJ347 TaxID=3342117 RepID=UPI0035A81C6B
MSKVKKDLQNFKDLKVRNTSLALNRDIYEATKKMISDESRFIAHTMKKSSCSIVSNIAEGCANFYYERELYHWKISLSKAGELLGLINIAFQLRYIEVVQYENLRLICNNIINELNSLIRKNSAITSNIKPSKPIKVFRFGVAVRLFPLHLDTALFLPSETEKLLNILPKSEEFIIKDQLLRASRSVTDNIQTKWSSCEGREFQALNTALGSNAECISLVEMAIGAKYVTEKECERILEVTGNINLILTALLAYLHADWRCKE